MGILVHILLIIVAQEVIVEGRNEHDSRQQHHEECRKTDAIDGCE